MPILTLASKENLLVSMKRPYKYLRYSFSSWMSLYWSVDLLILKMYWSGIGDKWRSTDHEYVLLWVSTDQCTFTIRISTDQDWAVKRRSTDHYSLSNEDLLIMNNVFLNVYWYLLFSAVQCIDPESLIFEFLLIMNICSNECVLTMTDNN